MGEIPSIFDTQDVGFSEFENLASLFGDPFHDENFTLSFAPPQGNVHVDGENQAQEENNLQLNQDQEFSLYTLEEELQGPIFVTEDFEIVEEQQVEQGRSRRRRTRTAASLDDESVALQDGSAPSGPTPPKKRRVKILTADEKKAENERIKIYRKKMKDEKKKMKEDLESYKMQIAELRKEKDILSGMLSKARADKELSDNFASAQMGQIQALQTEILQLQNRWEEPVQMHFCLCSFGLPCD